MVRAPLHASFWIVGETIDELTHDQGLVSHDEDRFEPNVRIVIRRLVRVLHALER